MVLGLKIFRAEAVEVAWHESLIGLEIAKERIALLNKRSNECLPLLPVGLRSAL
jgi:hypothetical protein